MRNGGEDGTWMKEPLKKSKLLTGLSGGTARLEDLCELEISMVYKASSGTARATSENLHEKKKKIQTAAVKSAWNV